MCLKQRHTKRGDPVIDSATVSETAFLKGAQVRRSSLPDGYELAP